MRQLNLRAALPLLLLFLHYRPPRFRSLPLCPLLILPHTPDQRTLHPNPGTIPIKHEWNGNDKNLQPTQKRTGPICAQASVKGRSGEGEGAAKEGSDKRVPRHGRGGVDAIGVDEVVGGVDEDGRVARSKGYARRDWDGPVNGNRHTGPRKPKFADGTEDGGDADDKHSGLRGWFIGAGFAFVRVNHAADQWLATNRYHTSNPDANEGKTRKSHGPASLTLEDDGVGYKTEI
jgi:hypothetical protein